MGISYDIKECRIQNRIRSQSLVLSHGIHSNLESWEDFGQDIAEKEHRDVWLIELTGGPNQDEDCGESCPAYDFSDLKTDYWPALVAAVEAYSGKSSVDYVGYDLGCTTALESLETYSGGKASAGTLLNGTTVNLASSPVDTFVGVGCIGNFSLSDAYPNSYHSFKQYPMFTAYINTSNLYDDASTVYNLYDGHLPGGYYKINFFIGDYLGPTSILANIVKKPYSLISNFASFLLTSLQPYPSFDSSKMSMKLYQDMQSWMNNPSEPSPGLNVNLNNFAVIQGVWEYDPPNPSKTNETYPAYRINTDGFVSNLDQLEICKNVNSNNKYYVSFDNINHFSTLVSKGLADKEMVHDVILDFLNNLNIQERNTFEIISDQSNCE